MSAQYLYWCWVSFLVEMQSSLEVRILRQREVLIETTGYVLFLNCLLNLKNHILFTSILEIIARVCQHAFLGMDLVC